MPNRTLSARFAFAACLAAGLSACKTAPPATQYRPGNTEQGIGLKIDLRTRQLPNGLQVVMVEDHTVPIVSYQSWFRVGSVDEHPGITGISHLFEHLMFKGTPRYGARQFFTQLEAKGAEVNAYTTRDYTVYYENFVPELLEKVVDMESDRMANLQLDEHVLNGEKLVVLEERRLRSDNTPEGRMQEALWQLAYRVNPYQWPVIGYPQDLLGITLPEVISYFKAHYQPANAAIVIVGDFNADKTFALLQKYYSPIQAQARPKRDVPPEPEQREERRLNLYDDVASERFAQAYHVTAADNDDSYALDVLANILFGGNSARAYRLLVDQKDIAASISGSAYTPTYPGLFIVSGTMKQGIASTEAEGLLDQVIHEVQESGVTQDEISMAVKQLTVQEVDSVRTPYGLGQLIGTVQMILGDPRKYDEDVAKYLKVTAADVKRVAEKYLTPNNRSIITLLPKPPGGDNKAQSHSSGSAQARRGARNQRRHRAHGGQAV